MITLVCGTSCPQLITFKQVTEWHKKMEEARLQELRKARELVVQKEEIRYLKNLVEEQERTIRSLEEDIVQQNTVRAKLSCNYLYTRSQIHKVTNLCVIVFIISRQTLDEHIRVIYKRIIVV